MFYEASGNVYITNFVEIVDTNFLANVNRNLNGGSAVVAALQPHDLVFGIPLIIGAKKDFQTSTNLRCKRISTDTQGAGHAHKHQCASQYL